MSAANAEIEEITVSAQRRDANLQEVPISISAFSAKDMARLQMDIVQDIAFSVPNMQTYTVTSNATAMQVFMRGAGIQNPGFNASESPVGFYIDDIYHGRLATVNVELTDIERIEVLRGPQGTLYGRNTIAGAVKIITRTPEDDFWADGSVAYGNYETTKVTASVGGPLIDGKLGGSLTGLYYKRDEGWIERGSIGGRDLGEFKNTALRGKLNWFGSDTFNASFSGWYVDAENDGYNAIPYGPSYVPPSSPGTPLQGFYDTLIPDEAEGFGESEQFGGTLELSWEIDSLTLRSITGYSDIDDDFGFDLQGGVFQLVPGDSSTIIPGVYRTNIRSTSNNKSISQEFTLSGQSFNDKLEWIAGVFFMNEDGDQDYAPLINVAPQPVISPVALFNEKVTTETDSYAVFAEGTWAVSEKLAVTIGGRWTRDEKDYSNDCSSAIGGCTDDTGAVGEWSLELDEDFDEFTPRLIVEYQLTEGSMVFGSVSKGFQAGGFQTLCFGNENCNQIIYDPQTVVSWEVGSKSQFFDNSLRLNIAAFYADYDDMQQTAIGFNPGGSVSFPLVNVGGSDVTGLEIEAFWEPIDGLNLFAIAGIARDDLDSGTEAVLGDVELPGLPEKTLRAGFDWRIPAFSGWDFLVGADINYADDYYATINNSLNIDSYTRWNGRIGLDQPDGNWSVVLSGKNLGDSEDNYSGIVAPGDSITAINIRTPQPPREYMLSLNYRY